MKKKKTAKTKGCQCVELANECLEESNACLVLSQLINVKTGKTSTGPPQLMLEKIDTKKRKRLPTLFCTYCPICGTKLPK